MASAARRSRSSIATLTFENTIFHMSGRDTRKMTSVHTKPPAPFTSSGLKPPWAATRARIGFIGVLRWRWSSAGRRRPRRPTQPSDTIRVTTRPNSATPSMSAARMIEPPRMSPAASGWRAMPSLAAAPIRPMPMPAPTATMPAPSPAPILARPAKVDAAVSIAACCSGVSSWRIIVCFDFLWGGCGEGLVRPGSPSRLASMLGVDRGSDEDDRELGEDVRLKERHEALDDHDERGEADRDGRDAPAGRAVLDAGEEEDQAHEREH